MHDSYLLLTPLLTLLVVALVGFVGCDKLFGLIHVDDYEELVPVTGVTVNPLDQRVEVNWDDYPNATEYSIHWGTTPGSHPDSRIVTLTDPRPFSIDQLQNGQNYCFVVNAKVGSQTPDSDEVCTVPGIYGVPTHLIKTLTVGAGMPMLIAGRRGMRIDIGSNRIQATEVGRYVLAGNNAVHTVRIIERSSKMQKGSGDVVTAGAPAGAFAYAALNPAVILDANTSYYIVSDEASSGDTHHDAGNVNVTTTAAASRELAAFDDFAGNFSESPIDGQAYGPVDLTYVDLPPIP